MTLQIVHFVALLFVTRQASSQFLRLCPLGTRDDVSCTESAQIDSATGQYKAPVSSESRISFAIIDNTTLHFGRASMSAAFNCYLVREGDEPTPDNRFIGHGCPERGGIIMNRNERPARVAVVIGQILPRTPDFTRLYRIHCFVVQCTGRKSAKPTGHECPEPHHCVAQHFWQPRIEFLTEAVTEAAFQIRSSSASALSQTSNKDPSPVLSSGLGKDQYQHLPADKRHAAPFIQLCRTPNDEENCHESVPIDAQRGTYMTELPSEQKVFFSIVDNSTPHFGKQTMTTPYNCHLVMEGEQPSDENRFISQGCPQRGGIVMYRSKQPARVEIQPLRLLPRAADLSRPFRIHCFVVQCAKRMSLPPTGHECPDPFHCDNHDIWHPRLEFASEAVTEAWIRFRLLERPVALPVFASGTAHLSHPYLAGLRWRS